MDEGVLAQLRYSAPASTVEPTFFESFNTFKKENLPLYTQYMELATAAGYDLSNARSAPLPQLLEGWPELFHQTRAQAAQSALSALQAGPDKNLLQDSDERELAVGASDKPFRARSDARFTLTHPQFAPLGEEEVTFAPEILKLGIVRSPSQPVC